jgi:regulator of protease activity HflC (stomatin/prohibitin superfamily)
METMETKEYVKKMSFANNGFLHLLINLAILAGSIALMVNSINSENDGMIALSLFLLCVVYLLHCIGFTIIQPNQSRVLTFFGKYSGTVCENGFFWLNPFYGKRRLSLRARNMDVPPIKVNDKNGNPIMIGLVLVWKIKDTYKASFNIDISKESIARVVTVNAQMKGAASSEAVASNQNLLSGYDSFVNVQSDAALRKVAGMYAYDNMDKESNEITLRSGGEEINERLEEELRSRLDIAGIEVIEARINYLAYAAEIASVMLRRQQADAIISAREKIVEGAVSMVDLALKKLSADHIVELDEEKKATMVSNLLVVLCADESASPVINTGTLYN